MTIHATMPEDVTAGAAPSLRALALDVACILLGIALALLVPAGFSASLLLPDSPPAVTASLGG